MRKTLKIFHTVAACGLIGGLACYMVLLATAPQTTPVAYADLRQSIAAISNYLLLPSLAVAVISGLLAVMMHRPFLDKGWVWLKAALGILMFKGVLTIAGAKADHAAVAYRKLADGEPASEVLDRALMQEWWTLGIVMALSLANVVLGIWRPRHLRGSKRSASDLSEVRDATTSDSRRNVRPAA